MHSLPLRRLNIINDEVFVLDSLYNKIRMLHKIKKIWSVVALILISSLLLEANSRYVGLSIQSTSTQINLASTYTFTINRGYDPVNFQSISSPSAVPLNTVIVFTLPSQFITISTSANPLTCINPANSQALTCNINMVAKTITVTDYYSTSSTLSNSLVTITMYNLINAYKAGASDNFFWQITYANGTIIDQGPPINNVIYSTSITFTPGTFTSCSISANGAYVSSYSPVTITLSPADPIPSTGQLIVTFPTYWLADPLKSSTISIIPSCSGVTNTGASVSCTYFSLPDMQLITISSLSSSSISSQFSIKIANILIPPTVSSSESLSIYSQWPDGIQINTCSSKITNMIASPFQTSSLSSNDNTAVQSTFTATLALSLNLNFYYQDSIQLTLPSDWINAQISSTTFSSFTRSSNLNTVTLTSFPSVPEVIASNNNIKFILSGISNPLSTAPVSVTVGFYRNSELYQQSVISYSATSTTVNSFSISADSNFVQSIGLATITIISTIKIPVGSSIYIVYPSTVTASSVTNTSVTQATLNGSVVTGARYQISNNQITFTSIFSSNFIGTVLLIIDKFSNPTTIQPSSYLLQIQDQNGYAVMSGSYSIVANTKALVSNTITASSYQVLQTGVTYTANITTNFGFTSVSIIIPSDITIGSGFQATCAPASFSSCSLSGNNLTFTGTLSAGSYPLQWGYVSNPTSFKPTSSFQIYTYFRGFGVQNSQGVLTIAMNTTYPFSNLILYPSSYVNSASITATLILTFPTNTPAGRLSILVPSELVITSATCSGCTISSPYIYITFSPAVSNTTIVISNLVNVGSFKPLNSFIISLNSSDGYHSLYSTIPGWTNNQHSSFVTQVIGNNNYKGESNNFKFQLTGLSDTQTYVIVSIASSFGSLSTAPSGFTLVNSYALKVSCIGVLCSFNFTITNPTISSNYTFAITSYTGDDYQVGTSTSNPWTFDCSNTNCRSCQSNGSCTSCYDSSIISNGYNIFNTYTSSCDRACQSGYFLINTTCSICNSNCSECQNTSKTCTGCQTGYFLDTTYYLCVPTCLVGYFANSLSKTCTKCNSPCATCTATAIFCLTCVQNTYLYNNQCLSICPVNFFIANVVTLKCDSCSSNCLTCSNTTSYCLTCNNTQGLYFQNNVCKTNCSSNYFIVNNICTYCALPCKVCSGSINVCSSCFLNSTTPIFFKDYCISSSQCPIGYYVNSTNSSCQTCPVNCSQCTSPTVCSSCSLGYYIYGTLCLSSCPNTTYILSNSSTGLCQACNNCLTCNSSTVCTSCITSQFLYSSLCYSICPNGTYSFGSICVACAANCPTCQNITYCTSCVTSMNLYKGDCYLICPNSTFAVTSQQICSTCPASCATCTSLASCQTCITSYSLEDSQCVLVCSKGLSFNQICYPCGLNCDICQNTTCTKCINSYYLYDNTCVSQCPNNMLTLDSMNCILCTNKFTNCSTCNISQCLTCTYGQLVSGSCIPCSPGYYAESSACTQCPSTCSTCDSQVICTSCKPSNYLLNSMCSSSCPINMFPNGTTCSICLANCNICNQVTSLCVVCEAGYYLYNNLCSKTCPSPLVVSYDFLTCVTQQVYYEQFSKAAKIVPFPFTIGAIIIIIIAVILRCLHKEMHLQTLLVATISIIQLFCWIIFIGFENVYYNNYHKLALYGLIGGLIGICILALFNFIHLRFFYKYISDDQQFTKWVRKNSCSNKSILTFATILTFKFYRLVHSKFLGRQQTSMVLSSPNRLIPFSLITVISIFLCSIPVFIGCGLALYNSISQDQEFYIAMDTITVTGLMIILMIMDLKHPDDYFIDEHEAKNLKKKVYQEEQIKFQEVFQNPMEDNVSHQQLVLNQDEGDMALPPSATKFNSTMYPNKTKQPLEGLQSELAGSQENIIEDEQSQQQSIQDNKNKWQPKQYDHHGYLIKYDAHNSQVKYDQNGYRVQIDDKGVHRRYNNEGNEMKMVNGKWVPHDKDGYRLINGKRYNDKGYQIRDQNGQHVPYDQNGFKVVGQGQNQRHVDQNGYTIKIDQKGRIRRYQQDGYEVVQENGNKLFKNKVGRYVRKNKNGQWQIYDPVDGFTLKLNAKTGKYQKFNDLGYRVVKDNFGNIHYYDEEGYKVTILPGNQIIRHDERNYRIQKDQNGKIHRFDQDGYELVEDQNGNFKFIDQNGYRVQRDLYGRVTVYDQDNNEVRIDEQTGVHRKFNEEGLQVVTDLQGNKKLVDKRGRIVKQLQDTYEKYDREGNKIWLDENGYQIEQDEEGNVNRYDKVGDRVNTEYEIEESEQFEGNLLIQTLKKPLRYKYKHKKEADQEQQLNKLLSYNQPIEFQEQQQIQQLHQFHDNHFPVNQKDVDYQFDRLVNKQRSQLLFKEQDQKGLQDLQEFEHKEELYGHLVEPNLQSLDGIIGKNTDVNGGGLPNQENQQRSFDNELMLKAGDYHQTGLHRQAEKGNRSLVNKQLKMQRQIDNQLIMRNLDQKQPHLQNRRINANHHLVDKELDKHAQFDQEFAVKDLDAKQPNLSNRALQGHRGLRENQSGTQGEYDKEALVKDIDQNEPDPIQLKKRDLQRSQLARKRAINNHLVINRDQDQIQIKSVADISVDQRSFENEGVHPLQNRTDFDQINSLDQIEVPLGRKQRGNRSELSLVNNKKNTQTVYNYNTVQVQIKNQNNLYDQQQDIQSLHEQDWQQQMNPMMFPKRQRVKDESQGHNNSNANTNILYIEDQHQDKDALSEFVHQSQSKSKIKPNPNSNSRYHKINDILSRQAQSIEQIQEKLFREASNKKQIRQRREFRLSGAPNPLVEYAKTIQANKKSLQQRMYLQHNYKK